MANPCSGKVSNPAPCGVGDIRDLPIDPATGAVRVSGGGGPSGTNRPIALITPGAAANSFTITLTTLDGIVYGFYWQVPVTVMAGLYAHLYLGNAAPVVNVTRPLKRSPNPITPGEEYFWEPPNGLIAVPPSTAGESFIMTLSLAQDIFDTPTGVYAFQARATGIF